MTFAQRLLLLVVAAVAAVTAIAGFLLAQAAPAPGANALTTGALSTLVGGAIAVAAIAAFAARHLAVGVQQPLQAVVEAAHALRQEQPVGLAVTGISECDAAITAIADTQANLRVREETLRHERALQDESTRACEESVARVQRLQAVGRLGGSIAHDFNNVLGVISNSLMLLQRLPSVDAHRMPFGAIERAAANGTKLTRQLQRLARPATSGPGTVDLRSALDDVGDLLKTAGGSTLRLQVDLPDDLAPLRVDGAELELALVNLVQNARDAMPAGGAVTVTARPARPDERAGLDEEAEWVVVSLADTGEGIDPALAERVFDRFQSTRPGRAGLGLAQVRDTCREAGGTALAGPGPDGRGTEIRLVLPTARQSVRSVPPVEAAPAAGVAMAGQDRLLLVEDNESLGEVTAALLAGYGYHVVRARHAADALARLADPGAAFDVVLSDVMMPGDMDGIELAQRLRVEHPDLPVVLISGYSAALSNSQDFEMLYKPYSPQDLVRLLRKVVSEAQDARHA